MFGWSLYSLMLSNRFVQYLPLVWSGLDGSLHTTPESLRQLRNRPGYLRFLSTKINFELTRSYRLVILSPPAAQRPKQHWQGLLWRIRPPMRQCLGRAPSIKQHPFIATSWTTEIAWFVWDIYRFCWLCSGSLQPMCTGRGPVWPQRSFVSHFMSRIQEMYMFIVYLLSNVPFLK